jgi:hypothetical protein
MVLILGGLTRVTIPASWQKEREARMRVRHRTTRTPQWKMLLCKTDLTNYLNLK